MAAIDPVGVQIITTADEAGITETEAGLASVKTAAADTAATSAASFENFNNSLKSAGESASAAGRAMLPVTAAVAAVGYESVKSAMNFQQSMEMLHTNAGVAQSSIGGLSNAILALAPQVGQGPEALATAMYHIASAGNGLWSTSQQLDILKSAAQGAAIGQADLDDTTYSLTSALASNVTGAKNASEMMSTLVAIVGAGDMHMQDLNAAIGTGFLGTAATFGVSIQSIGAALATLGDNGEQGAAAATRLRMMLSLMASPSQEASKQLSALGLTASDAATATGTMSAVFAKTGLSTTKLADDLRQPNGITVAIEDLKSHLTAAGLSASETDAILSKAFGGGRTDAALLQLLENTDRLNEKFQDINKSTGNFADDWAAQQQTMKQQWDDAWAGIQADMIRLGEEVMPEVTHAMTDVGNAVSAVTKWFDGLSQGQKQFVIDAAMTAAAAGPILMVFGSMAKNLSSILSLANGVGGALVKMVGMFGGVEEGGAALGALGGGEMAAGGATGLAGLAAAIGPVTLGIAALGAAAGGTYLLIKHFDQANNEAAENIKTQLMPGVTQFDDLAKKLGVTVTSTSSSVSMLGLAQTHAKDATTMLNTALTQSSAANVTLQNQQKSLTSVTNQYHDAQLNAQKALQQFGASSPQYQQATNQLNNAYIALAQSLNKTAGDSLQVQINAGNLTAAERQWHDATYNLGLTQIALNSYMEGGIGVIAKFGPTAIAQVGQVDVLQQHLGTIASTWNGIVLSIQQQSGPLNASLQGLGSTVNRLQGQSSALNATLSASVNSLGQLQNAGVNVQGGNIKLQAHASGGQVTESGWSLVGEEGPEILYLPAGAQVYNNQQTEQMMRGGSAPVSGGSTTDNSSRTTVTIQQVILQSAAAVSSFFTQLDIDTLSVSKGLTASRGA